MTSTTPAVLQFEELRGHLQHCADRGEELAILLERLQASCDRVFRRLREPGFCPPVPAWRDAGILLEGIEPLRRRLSDLHLCADRLEAAAVVFQGHDWTVELDTTPPAEVRASDIASTPPEQLWCAEAVDLEMTLQVPR